MHANDVFEVPLDAQKPAAMAAEDKKGKPIQSHKCDFVNQTSIASEGLLVMMVIVFVMLDV
ncbi:MAG: hypothetical protein ACPIOQ_65575, partial [Promethearchaeia archaeon]